MRKLVLFIFLTLVVGKLAFSQYFTSGEDPSRVKYNYINSPHFKVIYPRGTDDYAFRLASMLEMSYRNVQFSKLFKTKNISVLVHTRNSIANGYVSWAPRRMELMALPPYEFEALSWYRDLAIHEFRHVSQISSLYSGLTGVSYYLLGEQGIGVMTSLIPLWFYEGDAVYAETAFSKSGRGRNAEFGLAYRARLNEGYKFSFDQYLNGSYKTYIPSYYELGYLLTSYSRIKYGRSVWDSVMRYTTRNPFLLLASFSLGLKKLTGQTTNDLFIEALKFHDSTWTYSLNQQKLSPKNKLYREYYCDYTYPIKSGNQIFAFKSTLDRNTLLISVDSLGNERKLKTIGSINSYPSVDSNSIYWTEYVYAGRWSQEKFSVLRKYDYRQNKSSLVSDFGYYSYPAVKGDTIALIKNRPTNKIEIGLYTKQFKSVRLIDIPFHQAKDLQWDGNNLAYTTLDKHDNMLVVRQYLNKPGIDTLFNFGRRNIKAVKINGGKISFISDFSGKSKLYEYDIYSNSLNMLYEPTYSLGNYTITNTDSVYVQNYHYDGYKIEKVQLSRETLNPENAILNFPVAEKISHLEGRLNLQDSTIYKSDFKVKRYSKLANLFNFHSWAPFYFDPSAVQDLDLQVSPGFTLISQNLLSTSFTSIAYGYKNGGHIVDLSYTYKGWLPVFNLRVDRYNSLPKFYSVNGHPYIRDSSARRMQYGVSAYLPIQFSYGAWNGLIQPFVDLSHYNDILYNGSIGRYENGLEQVTSSLYAAWQMKLAQQNIFPRWGVNFYFKNVSAPFEKDNLGNLYAYRLGFLTPGLFANHGFMTRFCYQNQDVVRYYFSNAFYLPRGYNTNSYISNYYKAVFNDYSFPVAYPDFNVSWLVYLKRIRINLFADLAQNTYMRYKVVNEGGKKVNVKVFNNEFYGSYGADILFDFNALRTSFPITSGFRVAYNNNKTITWNYFFTFSVN